MLIILILLTVFGIDKKIQRVKWNIILTIPYQVVAVAILIYSFVYPLENTFIYFALNLLLIFPCLYIVWSEKEKSTFLFNCLAISLSIIGVIAFVELFHLAYNGQLNFVDGRMAGQTGHFNFYGFLGLMVAITSVYLLNIFWKNVFLLLLSSFSLITSILIVALSGSRAAFLCIIASVLSFIIFNIKQIKKSSVIKIMLKNIIVFSVCGIFGYLLWPCQEQLAQIQTNALHGMYDDYTSPKDALTYDIYADEYELEIPNKSCQAVIGIAEHVDIEVNRIYSKYNVELGPIIGLYTELYKGDILEIKISSDYDTKNSYPVYDVEGAEQNDDGTYTVKGEDVYITTGYRTYAEDEKEKTVVRVDIKDRFALFSSGIAKGFTGRLKIWKYYANKLGIFGNNFLEVDSNDFMPLGFILAQPAHNDYIEYSFRFGIPIGSIYLFFVLSCCFICLLLLVQRKHNHDSYLYIIIICASFFIETMLDVCLTFANGPIVIMFYLAISQLMVKTK